MKRKEFIEREIAGEIILVPTGKTAQEFNGLISLNELAKFIWDNIEQVNNIEEMVNIITQEYDVDKKTAKIDTQEFIDILIKRNMLEI